MKQFFNNYELDEICPVIYQKVLNDAKKVFEICQDENINFGDETSLYKFIQLYYCQEETKDEKKCDNSIAVYLKNLKEKKNIHLRFRNSQSCISKFNHWANNFLSA